METIDGRYEIFFNREKASLLLPIFETIYVPADVFSIFLLIGAALFLVGGIVFICISEDYPLRRLWITLGVLFGLFGLPSISVTIVQLI